MAIYLRAQLWAARHNNKITIYKKNKTKKAPMSHSSPRMMLP